MLRFLDAEGLMKREPRNNPEKAKPGKKRLEREEAKRAAGEEKAAAEAEKEAPSRQKPTRKLLTRLPPPRPRLPKRPPTRLLPRKPKKLPNRPKLLIEDVPSLGEERTWKNSRTWCSSARSVRRKG